MAERRAEAASAAAASLSAAAPVITVCWHGIASPSTADWVGLYRRSAKDWDITTWAYTNGQSDGCGYLTVPVKATAGPYELRLFSNDSVTRLALGHKLGVINNATVNVGSIGPWTAGKDLSPQWSVTNPTGADWIALAAFGAPNTKYLAYTYTSGAASGSAKLVVPAGTPPGEYELRLFSNDGFVRLATSHLTVTHPTARITHDKLHTDFVAALPGSQMTVTWNGIPAPSGSDWFGLFALGAQDTEYVGYAYTSASSGSRSFTIPATTTPGRYELRLFADDGYTRLAVSDYSLDIEVGGGATLGNYPAHGGAPACTAGKIVCSWQNVSSPTTLDWIGFYHRDAPDSAHLTWAYTGGGSFGSLHLGLPAGLPHGDYEVRMFRQDGFTRIDFDLVFL
jgi:hypothetical protein